MIVRSIRAALAESVGNLRDYDRWATLAWIDTSLRYRRTVLGPWWMTLSTGATVASVGILWGSHFRHGFGDLHAVLCGRHHSMGIDRRNAQGRLRGIHECRRAHQVGADRSDGLCASHDGASSDHFWHNAILIVILWAIFPWPLGWTTLLAILGLIIVMLVLAGGTLLLAILCTRYRDIP